MMMFQPIFLRDYQVADDGSSATGVIVFDPEYSAIKSRDGRVNQAECLHACWNIAHVMASMAQLSLLRAGKTTIESQGEAQAGRQYSIQAKAQKRMLGWGKFAAVIKDGERVVCEIKTLFFATK